MKIFIIWMTLVPFCFGIESKGSFCKTTLKAGLHGVVRDAGGKIIRRVPLGKDPVIIDTNVIISLEKMKFFPERSTESNKLWAAKLHKILKRNHKHESVHPYIAERTARERFVADRDDPVTFPEGTRIFEIEGSRSSSAYQSFLKKLEEMKVGQVKDNSMNDREIVADLFFAKRNYTQDNPTFLTADAGIFGPLCQLNPACASLNGDKKKIRQMFENGFEVTMNAGGVTRTVRIVPL